MATQLIKTLSLTMSPTLIVSIVYTLSFLSSSVPVNGANILAVLPSVWQSHYIFGRHLLEILAEQRNHTIVLISPYSNGGEQKASQTENDSDRKTVGEKMNRIREIFVDKLCENWEDMGLSFDIEQAHQQSMLERFTRLIYAGTANVDMLLMNSNVRKLLRSNEKFDLLIIDLFLSDALLGLALHYNIPTIALSPNGANTWLNRMLGNPQSAALDPSDFLPYNERMSYWERCMNTLMGLFEMLTYNFFHMISQQAVYVKHFQPLYQLVNNSSESLPHHRDLTHNLSLALLNSHPVVQYPRAFLPNVLLVGGVHLDPSPQPLPNHLKTFIENAKDGVVYMSLGANARTVDLTREKLDALYDVISYMKNMHFLLKWEVDEYPTDLPPNVLFNAWLPQQAILLHPNVKVFISSCGLMSTFESIIALTPLLALPIYTEQLVTATRLEAHGLAKIVPFDNINYENIRIAISELITNSTYQEQLKKARQLLTTEYGTPIAKMLHYIDLVLSTGGADFLKTHAHHLNFMRAKLFDVIAIIVLGLSGIVAIPFLVICCILKRSYHNNQTSQAATTFISANPTIPRSHLKATPPTTTKSNNVQTTVGMAATVSVPACLKAASVATATSNTYPNATNTRRLSVSALWNASSASPTSTPSNSNASSKSNCSSTSSSPRSATPSQQSESAQDSGGIGITKIP